MTDSSALRRSIVAPASLFLRVLGLVYVAAFISLTVQMSGLFGSHGILPVVEYLQVIRANVAGNPFWAAPSVFWYSASDQMLSAVCWTGAGLGTAVALGLFQAPALILLWMLYLSVCSVGQVFLGYQWDALLLETGFLAIFLAPWRPVSGWRTAPVPRTLVVWLLRFLLFRLMFASGVVKITSGDPTWHDLRALEFHYETQPIPPWTAFFMHQLPAAFQKFSCFMMFVVELILPFGMFLPRRARLVSFFGLAGLQVLIGVTGNYGYFNLLTFALCLLLLDDACFPGCLRPRSAGVLPPPVPRWRQVNGLVWAGLWLLLSMDALLAAFRGSWRMPWPVPVIEEAVAPFDLIHPYGLFAVMTTTRPQIIVEGSADGVLWKSYEFKYQPGDLKRRPPFVTPHMPRLDWQMWFASLGPWRQNRWFIAFLERLMEGSPEVLGLLKSNPFPGAPPKYMRATVYDYQFTDLAAWRSTGAWWRATYQGRYCPELSSEANADGG